MMLMKRFSFFSICILSISIIAGCDGGGGVEVGSQAPPTASPVTPEFRAAMEKAGNNMMKKARPKDFTGTGKKGQ
jgi:hypothetical protein